MFIFCLSGTYEFPIVSQMLLLRNYSRHYLVSISVTEVYSKYCIVLFNSFIHIGVNKTHAWIANLNVNKIYLTFVLVT